MEEVKRVEGGAQIHGHARHSSTRDSVDTSLANAVTTGVTSEERCRKLQLGGLELRNGTMVGPKDAIIFLQNRAAWVR